MRNRQRFSAALVVPALVAMLVVAVPGVSAAADPPRRIANMDGDYPGLYPADPEATGRVVLRLYPAAEQVCFKVRWTGMQVRAVYAYRRSTNELFTRLYDQAPTDGPSVEGCTENGVPRWQVRALKRHPGRFYVKAMSYDGSEQIAGRLRRPRN